MRGAENAESIAMPQALLNCLLVGAGGFAGALLRYLVALVFQKHGLAWPAGTLVANAAGCFAIGVLASLTGPAAFLSPEARLALAVGFCGGFTTMSSFMYEIARFLRDGEHLHAGGYVLSTLAGSFLCFYAGLFLTRVLVGAHPS